MTRKKIVLKLEKVWVSNFITVCTFFQRSTEVVALVSEDYGTLHMRNGVRIYVLCNLNKNRARLQQQCLTKNLTT